MIDTKFYISLLDFYQFDREHYVIGQNEKMLRIKVKQYRENYRSRISSIKYKNYWADHIFQRERQSVTYEVITEGIVDSMIRGLDNIIFACGPQCSGKTFNITGRNRKHEGIAPRLIDEMLTANNGVFAMSCVEIKNNRTVDLLDDVDDSARHTCLIKNVSVYKFDTAENAKRKLWEANAKRTVNRNKNRMAVGPSHVYDLVITFYWHEPPMSDDDNATETKNAKVHIVELAGAGSGTSKHEIQVNRNALEFRQFFKYVANVNNNNNNDRYSMKSLTTSTLLKYCQGSFSKHRTTLRPELAFLNMNISVLKFADALRKLPNSVVNVDTSKPAETIELYKLKEHFAHELHLYGKLEGQGSMMDMTEKRYERLRNKVFDFIQCKTDDIELDKWSYADAYTILSVFREYYDRSRSEEQFTLPSQPSLVDQFESAPFHLESKLFDKDTVGQMMEETRQTVDQLLAPISVESVYMKIKYWNDFAAENSLMISDQEKMSAEIRDAHRLFEINLENMLNVQEKLTQLRDRMDTLRRKRHLNGDEQYDGNMNVIVPDEEKLMFGKIKRVDMEMIEANDCFTRAQSYLTHVSVDYSKLKDSINSQFKEFLDSSQTNNDEFKVTSKASLKRNKIQQRKSQRTNVKIGVHKSESMKRNSRTMSAIKLSASGIDLEKE